MREHATRRVRTIRAAKPRVRLAPDRASLASALARRSGFERTLLALMLLERLSPAEAAHAVGLPIARFERSYDLLLAELERSAEARRAPRWRGGVRRTVNSLARLRKAA